MFHMPTNVAATEIEKYTMKQFGEKIFAALSGISDLQSPALI